MLAWRTLTTLCKRIVIMVSISFLSRDKNPLFPEQYVQYIDMWLISPPHCNYWWYSNPSFFIGQVLLTTDVWSSLWDVFYCDVGPPILVCWYTQSSVGTHGRMSGGNTYIAWLITLLWSITMTPLVAAQHNNTVELIVLLLIMGASLPFICQLTRATTRTRFSWVGVE